MVDMPALRFSLPIARPFMSGLRRGMVGLLMLGYTLAASAAWADEKGVSSSSSKYIAPFATAYASAAASQAVASPKQVEKAVQATLTDDQRIATAVTALLARNPLFADVRVLVNGSVVSLEGTVRNSESKALATKLAG